MSSVVTRVFMNGNSQAVRIPQEFRLDVQRVEIYRNANGDLVLHPVTADRGTALLEALNAFDPQFGELLDELSQESLPVQDREAL